MTNEMQTDRIEKVVELAAPVARVWRALTDYLEFGAWFRVELDGPFEVGKVTHGRVTYPGYEHLPWQATVLRMDHERLLSFSWPHSTEPDAADTGSNIVEFRLEPTAIGTRLMITESGFASMPDAKRLEALRGNTQGWDEQAKNIAAHVEQ